MKENDSSEDIGESKKINNIKNSGCETKENIDNESSSEEINQEKQKKKEQFFSLIENFAKTFENKANEIKLPSEKSESEHLYMLNNKKNDFIKMIKELRLIYIKIIKIYPNTNNKAEEKKRELEGRINKSEYEIYQFIDKKFEDQNKKCVCEEIILELRNIINEGISDEDIENYIDNSPEINSENDDKEIEKNEYINNNENIGTNEEKSKYLSFPIFALIILLFFVCYLYCNSEDKI